MQPARAFLLEALGDLHRVGRVFRFLRGVAAHQTDGATAAEVDRRDHDHVSDTAFTNDS